jgi:hypothetical protein
MTQLEISDLSFFELVKNDIEIKGGTGVAQNTPTGLTDVKTFTLQDINGLLIPALVGSSPQEVTTTPSGDIVEKIEDKGNGMSGFTVTSKDGSTKTIVLTGPNSSFVSASSST